jgi:DNA polymerase elongation subunit (family B)
MFNIYYPVFQNVVEILGNVTMKEITENSKGFLGMHLCRTCAQKAGIAFEGTNKDRWGERAINKQAALTNTFIPNKVFHNPQHLDFSSMYPSIVMTFNISPETTRIVGFEDFGPFRAWRNLVSGALNLSIPDEKLEENILIEISSTEGELPKLFKFLRNLRKSLKAEMKKYKKGTPKYMQLKTKESAVKMLMNSATGYMGEIHARFADLAQYIAIVGIGRELFKELVSFIEHRRYDDLMAEYEKVNPLADHQPDFDSTRSPFKYVIEGDTDGIYLAKLIDLIVVNRFLERLVKTLFKATENFLSLGTDEYDAIYCPNYKGKNYVLSKDDKLTFKGVAFKSSRWPPLFTQAVTELAIPRLGGEGVPRDIYNKWLRAIRDGTLDPSLYVMNMEVQSPEAYTSDCMPRQLAEQARERFHVEDFTNQAFSFVKTRRGYWIVARDEALPQLDIEYYVNILNQAVERLGMQELIAATRQTTISDMLGVTI